MGTPFHGVIVSRKLVSVVVKLLIVDDHPAVRRLIRSVVAGLAEEIVDCANGESALAVYNDCAPDLVLMDVEMEQLDGLAATRLICQQHPNARIIIVTNYDDDLMRQAAAAAGASGYVAKADLLLLPALIRNLQTVRHQIGQG